MCFIILEKIGRKEAGTVRLLETIKKNKPFALGPSDHCNYSLLKNREHCSAERAWGNSLIAGYQQQYSTLFPPKHQHLLLSVNQVPINPCHSMSTEVALKVGAVSLEVAKGNSRLRTSQN